MQDEILQRETALTPESMLCFDIYSTHHAIGQVYQPLLAELGLTYPQFLVMMILWSGDNVTVGEIGARLFLESSTLTPLIKRLEAQHLLTRRRDPNDERKVRIRLSDEGRKLETRAAHIPGCIIEAFGLTLEEFSTLHTTLNRVRNSMRASRQKPRIP